MALNSALSLWQPYEVDVGMAVRWRVGPLDLVASRGERDWTLAYQRGLDAFDGAAGVKLPADTAYLGEDAVVQRFGFSRSEARIALVPMLADRSVVVKPEQPFSLPKKEETTLFVSTPVWIRVEVGMSGKALTEIAAYRPSDTWLGPSTLEGELCYAARTAARQTLVELPYRPHRAGTVVKIRNAADDALVIEKINIPTPLLSLHESEDGRLWTQAVSLVREESGEMASLKLERGPGPEVGATKPMSGPRRPYEKGSLIRAFGRLIG